MFFGNFTIAKHAAILFRKHMSEQPELTTPVVAANENKLVERPFRVKLRGSVLVLVRLPNRRDVRAAFHQLSTTGGVIHFEKPLDEKIVVELIFHIGETTIREKAQMLFPMWATKGCLQPFRFTDLPDTSRSNLNRELEGLIQHGATQEEEESE